MATTKNKQPQNDDSFDKQVDNSLNQDVDSNDGAALFGLQPESASLHFSNFASMEELKQNLVLRVSRSKKQEQSYLSIKLKNSLSDKIKLLTGWLSTAMFCHLFPLGNMSFLAKKITPSTNMDTRFVATTGKLKEWKADVLVRGVPLPLKSSDGKNPVKFFEWVKCMEEVLVNGIKNNDALLHEMWFKFAESRAKKTKPDEKFADFASFCAANPLTPQQKDEIMKTMYTNRTWHSTKDSDEKLIKFEHHFVKEVKPQQDKQQQHQAAQPVVERKSEILTVLGLTEDLMKGSNFEYTPLPIRGYNSATKKYKLLNLEELKAMKDRENAIMTFEVNPYPFINMGKLDSFTYAIKFGLTAVFLANDAFDKETANSKSADLGQFDGNLSYEEAYDRANIGKYSQTKTESKQQQEQEQEYDPATYQGEEKEKEKEKKRKRENRKRRKEKESEESSESEEDGEDEEQSLPVTPVVDYASDAAEDADDETEEPTPKTKKQKSSKD